MTGSRSIPDRRVKVMLDVMATIQCQAAVSDELSDAAFAAPAAEVVGLIGLPLRRRVALLPPDARAASAARAVVRAECARWGVVGGVVELAVGCVSELAANAARHVEWGRVPFGRRVAWLVVGLWGPLLLVEVRDPSSVVPRVGGGIDWSGFASVGDWSLLPESGMGLRIVADRVEEAGGVFDAVQFAGGGKSVFFAVPVEVER